MEKKSFQGIPASSFLVAPSSPLALVSSCNEERTREGEDSWWQNERRRRAGLASWATRAFLNCIPACVATSRFTHTRVCTHASTHVYATYTRTYTYVHTKEDSTRSRLSGGGASSLTPRKYSGQYIPPPSFALLFRPSSPHFSVSRSYPSVYRLVLSFLHRHVRETAFWAEPISRRRRLTQVNSETLLSEKIRSATKMSSRPVLGRFCENSVVVVSRESFARRYEKLRTFICHFLLEKCVQ